VLSVKNVSILIILIGVASARPDPQIYYRDYKGMGCPDFNQYETKHLPHPYSCRKYLTCLSKSVIEQTCPGELHWNIEKNMCDYPDPIKCIDDSNSDAGQQYYTRLARRSRPKVY
jgi:Chitin binding Peritrophin-A domain